MAKKTILYPILNNTMYYDKNDPYLIERGLAGKPREVKGSLIEYYGYIENHVSDDYVTFVENRIFEDTLIYTGYSRGRSSAVFNFKDSTGATYQMFMTDFDDVLQTKGLVDKQVTAFWTYCKRGQNFGIKLAKDKKPK